MNNLPQEHLSSKIISNSETSGQVVENNHQEGKVFFIRHGESTSNERNIFAGVLDVDLTAFGRLQARQAGSDLKKKGMKFDAVYVSHMRRARQTCEIALAESQALKSSDIPIQIDHRISEKSFGIFAGRNLNLLRLALGISFRGSDYNCKSRSCKICNFLGSIRVFLHTTRRADIVYEFIWQ